MRRKQISVFVLAVLCALHLTWATSGITRAEVFDEYTVRMGAWAKSTVPGESIDVPTMMLGDDVSDVLTIMVVRDADGLTPTSSDLAGFCREEVAGSYFPTQTSLAELTVALPSNLEGSLGYWGEERWGSSFLICSLHDDAIYLFALLSTDTNMERTQALLTRVASAALVADPPDAAARYLEGVARRFGDDLALPLTHLPGSDAIPAEFQFVDRDYQFGEQ